jgi:hypothetical protein
MLQVTNPRRLNRMCGVGEWTAPTRGVPSLLTSALLFRGHIEPRPRILYLTRGCICLLAAQPLHPGMIDDSKSNSTAPVLAVRAVGGRRCRGRREPGSTIGIPGCAVPEVAGSRATAWLRQLGVSQSARLEAVPKSAPTYGPVQKSTDPKRCIWRGVAGCGVGVGVCACG